MTSRFRDPLIPMIGTKRSSNGFIGWIISMIALALSVLGIAAFIMVLVWHLSGTVWSISGTNGDVTLLAGSGISITPDVALDRISIANTGILSNIAGTCIGISTVSGASTISTTCTTVAGTGTTLSTVGTVTTISDTIALQTALTESDALGPQVAYDITMTGVPDNTWRTTTSGVFADPFSPGIVAGDGGQGNVAGTSWVTPAIGVYAINAHCTVVPSAYIAADHQSATLAISLGATTADPTTGVIPPGGRSSVNLAGGVAPLIPLALSTSATVHVCPTCLVTVGKAIHLHTRLNHAKAGPTMGSSSTYGLIASTAATAASAPTTINGDFALSPTVAAIDPNFVIGGGGTYHSGDAAAAAARADATILYTQLAALPCTNILDSIDLAGLTLTPGVYCFSSSGAFSTGTLTLDGQGNPGATFVFQFGSTLTTAASAVVAYTNSAQACGVFWQVGSSATFGATNTFGGTVVALTSISVGAGPGTYAGGLFARNGAVTFAGAAGNVVTAAASCASPTTTAVTGTFTCHLQISREE